MKAKECRILVPNHVTFEGKNDNLFDINYQYNRIRIWDYRNKKEELERTKEKSTIENEPLRMCAKILGQPAWDKPALGTENEYDVDSDPSAASLKLKEYSIPDLVKRFQFTLVGREMTRWQRPSPWLPCPEYPQ